MNLDGGTGDGFKKHCSKVLGIQILKKFGYGGPCLVKSGYMDILVRTPRQFSDVREYADALMSGSTLMISFEAVDCVMRNRIFDYLNGVSYIIGARVSKVQDDMLLYAPSSVEINKEAGKKSSRSWLGR